MQFDSNAKVHIKKELLIGDKKVTVCNGFLWPSDFLIMHMDVNLRYVEFQGVYMEMAIFSITGIVECDELTVNEVVSYQSFFCYGNPSLIHKSKLLPYTKSSNIEDFAEDTLELFVYYPIRYFESYEEMQQVAVDKTELSDEELDMLLEAVVGDAGGRLPFDTNFRIRRHNINIQIDKLLEFCNKESYNDFIEF